MIRMNREKIEIILIIERSSEAFYNYKMSYVAIYIPPYITKYEEPDIPEVNIEKVYCGVYQERKCTELLSELSNLGYIILRR